MNSTGNKPNFLIIGAARSGTTSLYLYLDQHPDVYFSDVKELNFFSNPKYWAKGFRWYESRFLPREPDIKRIGEASTSYTRAPFFRDTPQRIHDYRPDMKLIYLTRHPVDRLVSHYLHRVQAGQELRPFSEIVLNLENEAFAWQSRYHYQLSHYLEYFNRNQLFVTSIDELKEVPESVMQAIFRFLDIDDSLKLEKVGKVFNANRNTTMKSALGLAILDFYREHIQQRALPYRLKRLIQRTAEIGATPIPAPEISETERGLLADFYQNDARKLEQDFGVKTSHWFD